MQIPVHCPECGSDKLSWSWVPHNVGQATNGRLCLNEVISLFYVGCDECSETVVPDVHPDIVAAILNGH